MMAIPSMSNQQSSSAKSGDLSDVFSSDNSGMSVNFGDGVSQGNALPKIDPTMLAIIVLGLVLWKKYS